MSKLWIKLKLKCDEGCYIKCQGNAVIYYQITSTYKNFNKKLQSENSSMKIEVKNSKSTPVEKGVNCELQITIFSENGWDTVANAMKNVFLKLKSNPVTHFEVRRTFKNFNQ